MSGSAPASQRWRPGRLTPNDVVLAGGALALAGACAISPAASQSGPVLCPFRLATGLPCPGCGATRAWVAMAHGDVGAAVGFNPFASAAFVLTAVLVAWQLASWIPALATRVRRAPSAASVLAHPSMRVIYIAWIVWGVVRATKVALG